MLNRLLSFVACLALSSAACFGADTAELRAAFHKIIDRPKVDLAPEVKAVSEREEAFSYQSEPEQRVPGLLFKPAGEGKHPVVIVLHGTGSQKESSISWCKAYAAKGIIGVAIDGRYHGARGTGKKDTVAYFAAIVKAYKDGKEHPFYYDTVYDVTRLIDYLETRPDVDPSRIGVMGISKGGVESYLTAAMEPRIAAAGPCIGMQSFSWGLENDSWQKRIGTIGGAAKEIAASENTTVDLAFAKKLLDKLVPGIYTQWDGPVAVTMICPRPLMFINSDDDGNTPITGVNLCAAAADKAYTAAGAPEKFKQIIQEKKGHSVTKESQDLLVDWFVKWLKP